MKEININGKIIAQGHPTYFIADIAANHDGDLQRAKHLIHLAKEAGADAAKFQHFKAETIVSKEGFENMGGQQSHQSKWKKSVFEVYQSASVPDDWTLSLVEACKEAEIDFFTSPYSFEAIDMIDPYVPAYKVGSGDITWLKIIRKMCSKGKPVLLATGASTMDEVVAAVKVLDEEDIPYSIMQCNTNYTAELENFHYINLNVLKSYAEVFPGVPLGLSDHTPGHATVLGAVTLGACVIEKHFTDSNEREGPDHKFAMNPQTWREMVDRTRELENALGDGVKRVEGNETDTVIIQRRSLRAAKDLPVGTPLSEENTESLRPAPVGSLTPAQFSLVDGKTLKKALKKGDVITSDCCE